MLNFESNVINLPCVVCPKLIQFTCVSMGLAFGYPVWLGRLSHLLSHQRPSHTDRHFVSTAICVKTTMKQMPWNRFQPHIDPVQNRGKFLWTVLFKTCPQIIRSKIVVIKKLWTFFRSLGSRSLSIIAMLNFSGEANTLIHCIREDDTANPLGIHRYSVKFLIVAPSPIEAAPPNFHKKINFLDKSFQIGKPPGRLLRYM